MQEEPQAGWVQTSSPTVYVVNAVSGQDTPGLSFGNYQLVTYSGTVYDDLNGNGVMDPGDPGLGGVTVELLDSGGTVIKSEIDRRESTGPYSFGNLLAGSYTILELIPSGWYQTQPQNPFVYSLTATSGSGQTGLDFGNFQLIDVSGNVYNDLNGNGNLDPGDPGLSRLDGQPARRVGQPGRDDHERLER